MKRLFRCSTFFVAMVISISALSQEESEVSSTKQDKTAPTRAQRRSIGIEYMSWLENFSLKTLTNQIGFKGMYYGISVHYDHSTFRKNDGWGYLIGGMNGYGIAGSQSSDYFQNRVRLLALHGGFRYFWRVNSRFDIGPMAHLIYKSIQWPAPSANQELQVGPNPLLGAWLDSRFRLSQAWQLTQAVGVLQLNASMAWRLGAAYTF